MNLGQITRRAASRRVVAAATLLAFLVSAVGVPVPHAVGEAKDRSTPFPCMDRPCGCQSARQCWTSCCCTTLAERISWAQARGMAIPDYVAIPAQAAEAEAKRAGGCCGGKAKPAAGPSCCQSAAEPVCCGKAPKPPKTKPIAGWMARQCRGMDTAWASLGAALPPPAPVQVVAAPLPLALFAEPCQLLPGLVPPPDGPPPKA